MERLEAVADAGLFRARDALAAGVCGRELTRLRRAGLVSRLAYGVYSVTPRPLPTAEAVALSVRGWVSDCSAAAFWLVDLPRPLDHVDITVPRNRGRRADALAGVQLHRRNAPTGMGTVRGVRVSLPLRTCLDVARHMGRTDAVVTVDGFMRRRLVRQAELIAQAQALPPGPGRRRVLDVAGSADPASGSVLETRWRLHLIAAGLPIPVSQFEVRDSGGRFLGRVDFAWIEQRVICECDGFEWHSSRRSFVADRRRWRALAQAGWTVVSVTWEDLVEAPDEVVASLAALLAR